MPRPTITIQRPRLPTLWLDTNVVINLARESDPRCARLKKIVVRLTRDNRLLCPEADQREEFEGTAVDDAAVRELVDLSRGVSLRHRQGIEDKLVAVAMRAYVAGADSMLAPVETFFHHEPVEELERSNARRFVVRVGGGDAETLAERLAMKLSSLSELELARQAVVAAGHTYESQVAVEEEGYAEFVRIRFAEFQRKLTSGQLTAGDFWDAQGVLLYRHMWADFGGTPEGMEGLLTFFRSDYYKWLPTTRISSQLYADLLTDPGRTIKKGDVMDVQLLPVAIPISHYVLTDADMAERIRRRGIDVEWNTKVYSLRTADALVRELEHVS